MHERIDNFSVYQSFTNLYKFVCIALVFIVGLTFLPGCSKGDSQNESVREEEEVREASLGTIYYSGGSSKLVSFNLATGEIRETNGVINSDNHSMIFEDGIIYTGSLYGITAIREKDMTVVWNTGLANRMFGVGNPILANNLVLADTLLYIVSLQGATPYPQINAVSKINGTVVWQKSIADRTEVPYIEEFRYTTPVLCNDKIIVVSCDKTHTGDKIYCFNRFTGELIWKIAAGAGNFSCYPVVSADKSLVFVGSNDYSTITAINILDGSTKWVRSIPRYLDITAEMHVLNEELYFNRSRIQFNSMHIPSGSITELPFKPSNGFSFEFDEGNIAGVNDACEMFLFSGKEKKWEITLPSKKSRDSLWSIGAEAVYTLYQSPIVASGEFYYFHQYMNYYSVASDEKHFRKKYFYIIEKKTGKIIKEIILDHDLGSLQYSFMLVNDNKGYNHDKRGTWFRDIFYFP